MPYTFSVRSPRFETAGFIIALLALALAACSPTTSVRTLAPVLPSATLSSALLPATETPTLEPSPTLPFPQVILLIPDEADPGLASAVQERLDSLAQASGLRLETRKVLSTEDLGSQVKLVAALPPSVNLDKFAAQAPRTHFLAIGIQDLQPAANLQVVSLETSRPDQRAFLAGYMAAVITPDWRAGVLSQAGSVEGKSARLGFTNGVAFFCGLCRPAYPPFPSSGYPMAYELGSGGGEADWQAAILELKTGGVQTLYVDPAIASDGLLQALAQAEFNLIGDGTPPAGLQDRWIASIASSDPLQAVDAAWTAWAGGTSQSDQGQSFNISDVNETLLSPGRLRLVQALGQDLLDGYVDTGVDPATGEGVSFEQPTP